jgi:hypothetical protein
VAARAASTCESDRSALEIAITIVRFFSIRKSPIQQPDYRMVQLRARGSGAAIAKQTPPFALGKRAAFSRAAGAKSTPLRVLDATPKSMNRSPAFSTLLSASREPIAANAAVMMEGISEEP